MGGFLNGVKRFVPDRLVRLNWLRWTPWLLVVAIVGVVALTGLARHEAQGRGSDHAGQAFADQTAAITQAINNEMVNYGNVLAGFRGLYVSTHGLNSASLDSYQQSLNIAQNYPGLSAVSFVADQGGAQEQFIVKYTAGSQASGADLSTDTAVRQALEHARDSGHLTISAPLNNNQSMSIILPVYQTQVTPETQAARQSQVVGFMKTDISLASFFANAFGGGGFNGVTLQIYDRQAASSAALYSQNVLLTDKNSTYHREQTLTVGERSWRLVARAPANFVATDTGAHIQTVVWLVGGAVLVLLIACLIVDAANRRSVAARASRLNMDLSDEHQKALAQQTKNAAILASIADGVFALDMDGKVILFNKAAAAIVGRKDIEVLGKHFTAVLEFKSDSDQPADRFVQRALDGEVASAPHTTVLLLANGQEVPVATTAAPILDEVGKQLGVIVIFRDISHERELEKSKTEFVTLVSHQLRAPLTAMRLFVEMLLDEQAGSLTDKQRDYLVKVELSTARMIDLVADFLNISRIELDKLKIDPNLTQIEDLVEHAIEALRPLATQKQLTLNYDKPSLPPVAVEANLYNQIVNNLVNNAIRYTPSGGSVTVSLKRTDEGYLLDVQDTGIGIPQTAGDKLFERFYRADNAKRVEAEGSGLGLYLVKKILELSGGKVWFDSEEGKGTTFHVLIPLTGMSPKAGGATLES